MSAKSSDYYHVGDIIYQGKPLVKVHQHDLWDKVCANCYVRGSTLKKCGSCGVMKYCGKNCQKEAWPDHKFECPYLPTYSDFTNQLFVQLVGNLILKLKGRDWKSFTERLMDKEVSFDDLVSHTGTRIDPCLIMDTNLIKDSLVSYIGEDNLPDENSLREIIGKVQYNQFSFSSGDFINNCDCRALFIGASKFDHSCVPNATRVFHGITFTVIAKKNIHKKTEKVTFTYGQLVTNLDSTVFESKLKTSFLNGCHCDDCSQPTGESTLTKIIDAKRAMPVLHETKSTLLLVALLDELHYPIGIVTRDRLKQLLDKQRGVLGKTNLLRMRTLALRCLFLDGPLEEVKRDLLELEEAMISAWGENYEELFLVYKKLAESTQNSRISKRHLFTAIRWINSPIVFQNLTRGNRHNSS